MTEGTGGGKASMLQRILTEMYVEPELLDELDEEQKQILFCKMREEQLRRWALGESEYEAEIRRSGPRSRSTRRIGWLNDARGDPWTWVMGDHPEDPSIDQIMDNDFHERAASQAEAEAERLRALEEEELKAKLREEIIDAPDYPTTAAAAALRAPTPGPSAHTNGTANGDDGDEYAALMQKLREAKLTVRQQGETRDPALLQAELHKEREALEQRLREEAERRIAEEKERRESEIYASLKEASEASKAEALDEAEPQWWRVQEHKARAADEEIRCVARKARETLRQLGGSLPPALSATVASSSLLAPPPAESIPDSPTGSSSSGRKRVAKPSGRPAIRDWFIREELPRGTGRDPKTQLIAPWFHGFLSRDEARALLRGREFGSFLVRVSEKIWGYTLSFAASPDEVKHFLIERVDGGYQFMGSGQIVHGQLYELLSYHESVPVTAAGREILARPVGQAPGRPKPDYADLFPPTLRPLPR